ncbi:hypothetical protein [Nocardioides yefusunii]|uniref:Uncharacterized protein n=1 Tax=Nocardioides yefusunii TaxID=2500546 RepID=A0ABW1QUD0_9ACTN|nr:hypothetical protein [Nocardioides yefusunii]
MRAIFFDEDDAAAVVRRLTHDGYDAQLERERFQGEDDDEDHPWAVLSDAPEFVLEVLVDEYDGWLDHGDEPEPVVPQLPPLRLPPSSVVGASADEAVEEQPAPLDLPSAPRRVKRPDLLSRLGVRKHGRDD